MEGKAPNANLPTEIWHLIINNLDRKGLARASMTCSTFRNIVENDEILRKKLHLPSFDPISSQNVQLSGYNHNIAMLADTPRHSASYPSWHRRTACVVSTGNCPEIVHFRVTNPGHYFCASVNEQLPHKPTVVNYGYSAYQAAAFSISYYPDGDVHTYGEQAEYRREGRDAAGYATDDIISIWVDSFPKGSPSFAASVSCPALPSRTNPDAASCDRVLFCAFFKNGVMVHDPFTLEGLVLPVYICIYFDGPTDKVEIVEAPFKLCL